MDAKHHINRPRGMLTNKDRQYLIEGLDAQKYEDPDNAEYQKRHRIRERVSNAILDFYILRYTLSHDDLALITDDLIEEANLKEAAQSVGVAPGEIQLTDQEQPPLVQGIMSTIAFLFLAMSLDEPRLAAQVVARSVEGGVNDHQIMIEGRLVDSDVDFNIDIKNVRDLAAIETALKRGNYPDTEKQLNRELVVLARAGRISPETAEDIWEDARPL